LTWARVGATLAAVKEGGAMAMGEREAQRQEDLWIVAAQLPQGPGHPFYRRLNDLLAAHGFDAYVEACAGSSITTRWAGRAFRRACTSGCCSSVPSRAWEYPQTTAGARGRVQPRSGDAPVVRPREAARRPGRPCRRRFRPSRRGSEPVEILWAPAGPFRTPSYRTGVDFAAAGRGVSVNAKR